MSSAISTIRVPRRQSLAACVSAVFALSAPATVFANAFTVTNCLDLITDVGSLRWAASKAGSGDIIDMSDIESPQACTSGFDGFQEVITLNSVVTVADGVTINGPPFYAFGSGLAVTTKSKDRIFSSYGYITINNLAMVYGTSSVTSGSVYGGCVYANKGIALTTVTLDRCVAITFSKSSSDSAKGGAVGTYSGPITLTDSRVTRSNAYAFYTGAASGGALSAGGDVSLTGAYIGHGKASTANGDAVGGGIAAIGNVTLANSQVTYVTASSYNSGKAAGGAIFGSGNVTLSNSVISHNSTYAVGSFSKGAGIYSIGSTAADYSSISDNSASGQFTSEGAGIYSRGGLGMAYSNLNGNRATNTDESGIGGGAIVAGGNTYLRGASVFNNYAQAAISGLDLSAGGSSVVTIVNSTISGNSTPGEFAVYAKAFTTKFFNSTFAYNTSGSGAGVTVSDGNAGSTAGLYSTLISSNSFGSGTQNDFVTIGNVAFTANSSNNLIRNPGGPVPAGTLTGKCPLLHPLASNGGPTPTHRLGAGSSSKNPAIDAGSNRLSLGSDQRGGSFGATTPLRVSGSAADIGAYEVQHADIIFDSEFDTCPN